MLLALLGVPIQGGHPGYQAYIRERQAIINRASQRLKDQMVATLNRTVVPEFTRTVTARGYVDSISVEVKFDAGS